MQVADAPPANGVSRFAVESLFALVAIMTAPRAEAFAQGQPLLYTKPFKAGARDS